MYLRLMNKLDVDLISEEQTVIGIDSIVINRINEIVKTLDEAYGMYRNSKSMGGYVLLFKDSANYANSVNRIMDFYNLAENEYEYLDCIHENERERWMEALYLLSSDDSLVLVYPEAM